MAIFGVNFGFEIWTTLFSCAQSSPLYLQDTVATENQQELIFFVLGEYKQYMFEFWSRFAAQTRAKAQTPKPHISDRSGGVQAERAHKHTHTPTPQAGVAG